MQKDKQGLYFQGSFKTDSYTEAIKDLFEINEIPKGFCVNEDHPAAGYSVVDSNGIQHIYDLSPKEFYDNLMKMG